MIKRTVRSRKMPPTRVSKKSKAFKPKKAMTPFMVFSKEVRQSLVEENPSITFSEIGKLLGQKWRNMSDVEKQPYIVKANEDYERFLYESQKLMNLTAGTNSEIKNGKIKKRRSVSDQKNTKVKKSISAYLYFCNAQRNRVKAAHPELKMVEIQRLLAEKWKKCPEELKMPFKKQAEADRRKYNIRNSDKNSSLLHDEIKFEEQEEGLFEFLDL